jgi:hypothetical protein
VHLWTIAHVVFVTEQFGEIGWCGLSDRGPDGPCVFCSDPQGHADSRRIPRCTDLPDRSGSTPGVGQ